MCEYGSLVSWSLSNGEMIRKLREGDVNASILETGMAVTSHFLLTTDEADGSLSLWDKFDGQLIAQIDINDHVLYQMPNEVWTAIHQN